MSRNSQQSVRTPPPDDSNTQLAQQQVVEDAQAPLNLPVHHVELAVREQDPESLAHPLQDIPETHWTNPILVPGYAFPPVRFIHKSCVHPFLNLATRILRALNAREWTPRCAQVDFLSRAFLALPLLALSNTGKRLSTANFRDHINRVAQSADPVAEILTIRHRLIQTRIDANEPIKPKRMRSEEELKAYRVARAAD
jgi:hypothetical protein